MPEDTHRIVARFVPQAWVRDYAVEVDPYGPTTWDVTDQIVAMGEYAALALVDDQYATDDLRNHPNAPQWVKDWTGPFYVEVQQAIEDYFGRGE